MIRLKATIALFIIMGLYAVMEWSVLSSPVLSSLLHQHLQSGWLCLEQSFHEHCVADADHHQSSGCHHSQPAQTTTQAVSVLAPVLVLQPVHFLQFQTIL